MSDSGTKAPAAAYLRERRTIEVALGTSGLDAQGAPIRAPLVVQDGRVVAQDGRVVGSEGRVVAGDTAIVNRETGTF